MVKIEAKILKNELLLKYSSQYNSRIYEYLWFDELIEAKKELLLKHSSQYSLDFLFLKYMYKQRDISRETSFLILNLFPGLVLRISQNTAVLVESKRRVF